MNNCTECACGDCRASRAAHRRAAWIVLAACLALIVIAVCWGLPG